MSTTVGQDLSVDLTSSNSIVVTHVDSGKSMWLKPSSLVNIIKFAIQHAFLSWDDIIALAVWRPGSGGSGARATDTAPDIATALGDTSSGPRGACLHIDVLPGRHTLISLYYDKLRDPGSFVFWKTSPGMPWAEFERHENIISASLRLMELTRTIARATEVKTRRSGFLRETWTDPG